MHPITDLAHNSDQHLYMQETDQQCQRDIQREIVDMNILLSGKKNLVSKEIPRPKVVSRELREVPTVCRAHPQSYSSWLGRSAMWPLLTAYKMPSCGLGPEAGAATAVGKKKKTTL